ncbi:MAG: hypothetical protein WCK65_12745 [Rhodospirillaceae bacterium]
MATVFKVMIGLVVGCQDLATGLSFNICFRKGLCPAAFAGGHTKTMILGGSGGGTTSSGTSARHLRALIRLTADEVRPKDWAISR